MKERLGKQSEVGFDLETTVLPVKP